MIKLKEENKKFDEFFKKAQELSKDELLHIMSWWYIELQGASALAASYAEENFANDPMHKVASAFKRANFDTAINPSNIDYILSRRER